MKRRILILDNNSIQPCGTCQRFHYDIDWPYSVVHPFKGETLPDIKEYTHIILTGGSGAYLHGGNPHLHKVLALIKSAHTKKVPLLGFCLGHELIAKALSTDNVIRPRSSAEIGWVRVHRIGESRLLAGLPKTFYSFANHGNELIALPDGFRSIARTRRVDIAAYEHESHPTFGVQFHPEKTPTSALRTVWRRKKQHLPKRWFSHPYAMKSSYTPKISRQIFQNFYNQ